jgi:hypothetical protein
MNADTDWAHRATNIGSAGHAGVTIAGWCYRLSGIGYSGMTEAALFGIAHGSNGRYLGLGFDNRFDSGAESDPYLAILNSQTGNSPFAGGDQPPFDEWFFAYMRTQTLAGGDAVFAEWSTDGSTWHTETVANGIEDSVQAEQVLIGRVGVGAANTVIGYYAYIHAYSSDIGETAARALFSASTPQNSPWAFWPLADNTDTGDDSGNSRTLTFNGSMTTETSPDLGGGGGPTVAGPLVGGRLVRGILTGGRLVGARA